MLAKLDLDNDNKLGSSANKYRKYSGANNDPSTKNKFGGSRPAKGGKGDKKKAAKPKKEK